ncbi:hypothetical protein HPB52_005423 [Rhipicephalus sanguineus]|uniref:Tick transposon n=1 Tax=Rhipicephalus sanguineus TaxID=34632 RepID=A0A9D4T8M3_RHISA|nr:hypothetical protein HPB52_005423 [Rhipicephalus sanguineus]
MRHLLGDPSLSARTTRYASTVVCLEDCCLCHTPAAPKLLLSDFYKQSCTREPCAALHTMYPERFPSPDCPLCGGYADFEHVLWDCASAGPPFTQEEMKKLIKAQDQTSQILEGPREGRQI